MTDINLSDVAGVGGSSDYSQIDPDVIRTIIGEGDPEYVASVLRNRHTKSGLDYGTLINDEAQFSARNQPDAWKKNSKIAEDSPEYQKALKLAGPILLGEQPPKTEANSFHATSVSPSWDDGTGETGPDGQIYLKDKYVPPKGNLLDLASGNGTAAPSSFTPVSVGPDVDITSSKTGERVGNTEQQLALRRMQALGDVTDDPKGGSLYKGSPIYTPSSTESVAGIPTGSYYVDPKGELQYTGPKKDDLGAGALEGVNDAALSVIKNIPGTQNDDFRLKMQGLQNQFNASNRGSPVSDLGRFGGQMAITAPLIAAGGGLATLAARGAPVIAPVVSALGGTAGTGLARGASIAANSALQGATQSGLTSSTSNEPLWKQMAEGGAEGAVLGPVVHGLGSAFGNMVRPKPPEAIANLVDKAVNQFDINLKTKPTQDATQHSEWIKAAASTAGADVSKISHNIPPEILAPAIKSAGNTMNSITAKYSLPVTNDLKISLNDAYNSAKSKLDETQMKSIDAIIAGIRSKVVNGEISGPAYQNLMGNRSTLSNAIQGSGPLAHHALEIKDALDDAFQTVLGPEDANIYSKARLQYKNGMTLAKAIGPNGSLEPDALYQSVVNRFKNKAIYGAGPLGTVADIGQVFMKPKPVQNFLSKHIGSVSVGTGAAAMSAAQGLMHNPGAAVGAATLGATGAGINAFLRNRSYNTGQAVNPLLKYLNNQWAVPTAVNAVNATQGR